MNRDERGVAVLSGDATALGIISGDVIAPRRGPRVVPCDVTPRVGSALWAPHAALFVTTKGPSKKKGDILNLMLKSSTERTACGDYSDHFHK